MRRAEFNQLEAAELLGVGERTFRRWRARFEEDGEAGLLDRRLGKASGKRVPAGSGAGGGALYRDALFSGFTAKHFHEHLVQRPRLQLGLHLDEDLSAFQRACWNKRAKRRGAHRRKRPRRPLPGMMLHQDGSRHEWLAGQPALDLIVTMDDATSGDLFGVPGARRRARRRRFGLCWRCLGRHGLPLSLYTDRGSHYFPHA
jgi:hypothetical protein